jgi:hypothetical protein
MSASQEDFEQLRKLLKLKRYEQPPPGYFDRLSDRITNQLERDPQARHSDGWAWLGRLRQVLAENPISAGIFAVCGVMMVVVANSQYLDNYIVSGGGSALNLAPGAVSTGDLADKDLTGSPRSGLTLAAQPALADTMASSVNPVFMNAPDSLLNSMNLSAQPVSYTLSH